MNAQFREIPNCLLDRWNRGEDTVLARLYESHYANLKERAEQVILADRGTSRPSPEELIHGAYFRLQRCRSRNCRSVEHLLDMAQGYMKEFLAEMETQSFAWRSGGVFTDRRRKRAVSF